MNDSKKIDIFKMVSFDQINEMATFAFMDDSNTMKHIIISRPIFKALLSEKWDAGKYGQITTQQYAFKICLKTHGIGIYDWNDWFDNTANSILKSSAQGVSK